MATTGQRLQAERHKLAERIVEQDYAERPELLQRYGPAGRVRYLEDAASHFSFLGTAIDWQRPSIFLQHVSWIKVVLCHRGVTEADLQRNLELMRPALSEFLPQAEAATGIGLLDQALQALSGFPLRVPSFVAGDAPLRVLAREFLQAILAHDHAAAVAVIRDELKSRATPLAEIYAEVFEPVQREIGRLWQIGQVSVAEEHYCTGVTELVISQVAIPVRLEAAEDILLMCVDGEQHDFGLRMVGDIFRLEGWNPVQLGASVPAQALLEWVQQRRPTLIGLSICMAPNLYALQDTIQRLRAVEGCPPILVGGYLLTQEDGLWSDTGADAFAPDARTAVKTARELVPLT